VVEFDDETRNKVSRVEELIEGRFPGVTVRRTNAGDYSVNIRGVGSFMSSEEPLFVVDGVAMEERGGRGLSWLSPSDVERIEVLRDPVNTSMYGVRGANGVILITTKRPP
jgi:TonB-dependent SusC/RagA subfamily outer membrane receptor